MNAGGGKGNGNYESDRNYLTAGAIRAHASPAAVIATINNPPFLLLNPHPLH